MLLKFYLAMNIKLLKNTLLLLLLLLTANISKAAFNFEYSLGIFKGSDGKSILEVYYSFYKKGLAYSESDGKFNAEAKIDIDIYNLENNELISSETYKIANQETDTSVLDNNLVGQINYHIPPGKYKIVVNAYDSVDETKSRKDEREFVVVDFITGPVLSDIELATLITKSTDDKSIFYKNTLEVVPNPNSIFGNNINELYYYFELYGLNPDNITDEYFILIEIKNLNKDNVYYKTLKKLSRNNAEDIVQFGSFMIDSLQTDKYLLEVTVVDSKNNEKTRSERSFWVYNSNIVQNFDASENSDFLRSNYANMREDLVEKEFEITTYIRTASETATYNKLTNLNDKRKFMYEFWLRRDPNSSTPQNEYKIDYVKRVLEADASFKEQTREGWQTDRGRIYVLYGRPDDIERYPFEANKKQHEIWRYEKLEGGAICVFVERPPEGSGFFDLVHSTIRTEIRNDNWESDLNY